MSSVSFLEVLEKTPDRKGTRLNSSHSQISYAVFCLKKKAQGAYEASLSYARERTAFGKTIDRFQAIQWKLADNATRIEAARLMTYRAAFLKDRGERMTLEIAMAKLYASEIAVQAADDCVQVHGGYGVVK